MRLRLPLVAGLVVALGLGVAWFLSRSSDGDPTEPLVLSEVVRPAAAAGLNLLLITLDTTRPDYLGCYGQKEVQTPAIDSLLRHGVRFDDAVASVPLTLPSHASLMTGRYPPAIGVRDNGSYRLAAEHTTLAEMLKGQGYDTAAFVAAFSLDRRFGLDQGFDVYDFSVDERGYRGPDTLLNERDAATVSSAAIRWFQQRQTTASKAPFFAWVHYFDPHHPYQPPNGSAGQAHTKVGYRAEIAYMDSQLGRLLGVLDTLGLREQTLIVLVSDHGESLTEHGERKHGIFIYEATIRVALILSNPRLFDRPYRVDDRVVALVDVVPTTLDLLGLAPPPEGDGQSLVTAALDPDRVIYLETLYPYEKLGCSELYGLRRHTDKYVLAPTPEYYNLREDPQEQSNSYRSGLPQLTTLKLRLAEIQKRYEQSGDGHTGAVQMSTEEQARLQSLGYIGSSTMSDAKTRPDPKDRIQIINQVDDTNDLLREGKYEEALAVARQAVAGCEGYDFAVHMIAEVYAKTDRLPEACRVLQEYAVNHPSAGLLTQLAEYYFRLGSYDLMEESLKAAEVLDPFHGMVPSLRGARFFKEGRYAEAVAQFERALAIDGERLGPKGQENLGTAKRRLAEQTSPP